MENNRPASRKSKRKLLRHSKFISIALAVIIISTSIAILWISNILPSLTSSIIDKEDNGESSDIPMDDPQNETGQTNDTEDNATTDDPPVDNGTLPSDPVNHSKNGSVTIVFRIISGGWTVQNFKVYINNSLALNYSIADETYIPVGRDVYVPIQYEWGYDSDNSTNLPLILHSSGYVWSVYNDQCGVDYLATLPVQDGGTYQIIIDSNVMYLSYSDYEASWNDDNGGSFYLT